MATPFSNKLSLPQIAVQQTASEPETPLREPDIKVVRKVIESLLAAEGGRPRLELWKSGNYDFVRISVTWKYLAKSEKEESSND